jgi:hypothetical protein
MTRLILATLAALALPGVSYGHTYRFDDADVLNLSAPERLAQPSRPVPGGALTPDQAQKILAAAKLDTDAPGQIPYSGDYDDKVRAQERLLITGEGNSVQRTGKQLTIKPTAGKSLSFRDWTQGGGTTGDGDSERFVYAGRIGASGYHRVEVLFGQDSPGSFLVNPASGKTAFVHNGSDVAALSGDGKTLLAFDPLNAPYLLVIAALDAAGPTIELQCRTADGAKVAAGSFKGWSGDNAFAVVYSLAPGTNAASRDIPVRFDRGEQGWHWSAPDAPLFGKTAGFACSH